MANWEGIHEILSTAERKVRGGIVMAHTLTTPKFVKLGNLLLDVRYEYEDLERKLKDAFSSIAHFQTIVDKLPKTKDGVVVAPGMIVWWYDYAGILRCAKALRYADYTQASIHTQYGWVALFNCYPTREAAEAEGGE